MNLIEFIMQNDIKLFRRISHGDRHAFSEFYDQHSLMLFHNAFMILNDQKAAEDVLFEVFLQIWDQAGAYDPRFGKPASWATALTRSKAIHCLHAIGRDSRRLEKTTGVAVLKSQWPPAIEESFRSQEG
jgi:DNA-directed RNA polymerase specialized sigma24 family protein